MTTYLYMALYSCFFFFQAEDGIRDLTVTGVQTCALPISTWTKSIARMPRACAVRNCFQVGPVRRGAGSTPASCRICHTVEAAIGWPGLTSSPCTRVPTLDCPSPCGSRACGSRLLWAAVPDVAG